jgi:hypothetical protein
MSRSDLFGTLGVAVWFALLTAGWLVLLRHQLTPGRDAGETERWPARTALTLDPSRPTLVLFVHRNCPCTRATLQELEQILKHAAERVHVEIVLAAPAEASEDRVGAGIEAMARTLPGVQVRLDAQGEEARRFGVRTSGHALLYDAEGRLRFSGGLTDSRGHAGESAGRRAVLACLQDKGTERKIAPVYGCPLFADDAEE